mgnify:CR=1 FL=1
MTRISDIPFNNFLGISTAKVEDYILKLDNSSKYLNHLGAVHASAQFALAEATSGEFLFSMFKEFIDSVIPVVRRAEVKYSKPANGEIYARAEVNEEDKERVRSELNGKGRTIIEVKVNVYDQHGTLSMQSTFQWFIQKNK